MDFTLLLDIKPYKSKKYKTDYIIKHLYNTVSCDFTLYFVLEHKITTPLRNEFIYDENLDLCQMERLCVWRHKENRYGFYDA